MRGGSKPGERRGGRQKGTPNRVNLAARLRVLAEADPIGKLIHAAETGTVTLGGQAIPLDADQYLGVLRELRKIAVPDAKSAPVRLDGLPEIRTAADVLAGLSAVLGHMTSGALTPDEAATVASVVELQRKAIETADFEARLARLEQQQTRER